MTSRWGDSGFQRTKSRIPFMSCAQPRKLRKQWFIKKGKRKGKSFPLDSLLLSTLMQYTVLYNTGSIISCIPFLQLPSVLDTKCVHIHSYYSTALCARINLGP